MKVKGRWEFGEDSIPGFWIDDSQSQDGKRFEATEHGWKKLRTLKCEQQYGRCTNAGNREGCKVAAPIHSGELHHTGGHGRGLGGAWRDDRFTAWLCKPCHRTEHGGR